MAVNTFGLTVADISAAVQNLSITATTSPTATAVAEMIELAAAEVERECDYVGISSQGIVDATTAEYKLVRSMIKYKAIAEILIARERGNPAAGEYYISRYDSMMKTLLLRPAVVAASDEGPDLASYVAQTDGSEFNIQFYLTMPGAVVLNGI